MTRTPADAIRFYDRSLARLSRRELLNVAWKLGLAAIASPLVSSRVLTQPIFGRYPFTLGVASGDPLPDGVVLWTRLAPEPLAGGGMPMADVEVSWEVAPDAAFRTVVQKGAAVARPELGHSVHVEVTGLQPGRDYWYRFRVGDEVSQTGRTVTAPAAGAAVDRLRFGVCGCSHFEVGYFTAFRQYGGRALRLRLPHRRLHLRGARQRRQKPGAACGSITARKSIRRGLSQPLRPVQVRPGSASPLTPRRRSS